MSDHNCENKLYLESQEQRLVRMEAKIDSLLEFKWGWVGKMSMISAIFAVVSTIAVRKFLG